MTRQGILIIVSVLAITTAAALAQEAAPETDPATDQPGAQEEPAAESAEQIIARELCTETAAPGAYQAWSIRQGQTCTNSFTETCRIVRNADGAEASYACYTPLPMPEPQPGPEPEAGTPADETPAP